VSSKAGDVAGDIGHLSLPDPKLALPVELGRDRTPYNAQCVMFICQWLVSLVDPHRSTEQVRGGAVSAPTITSDSASAGRGALTV
jgi:hypothetical protein